MPLQARQIKTPRRLFLAEFFFVFSKNLWPKFFPLFILQYIFIITIIFILLYLHLIMCILYYTLHYMCTRSWKRFYEFLCVYHHVISRHASRGGGNYLIFSGIIFFSPPPSTSRNYEITGFRSGYRKKAFRKLVCTSVIVSPNNHHNNRPGRCECSVRLLWIKKKIIHKNRVTLHVCCDVCMHLVVVVVARRTIHLCTSHEKKSSCSYVYIFIGTIFFSIIIHL